ncbi:MAG: hypothetical protein U9O94_06390 [Nanoarchaeota archaeon]|nr:hypothetical protein [Nanoarchaeota archaeon]
MAYKRYKNKAGKVLKGVTTITENLGWNKRVLVNWANRIGLQGTTTAEYTDPLKRIGTLGHAISLEQVGGDKPEYDKYTKDEINRAENCALSFFEWMKGKKIEGLKVEHRMVSEEHQFGGTCDFYAIVDGYYELIDLKTGSGIYEESKIQVAGGYTMLMEEHHHPVDRVRILNIPRSEGESFNESIITKNIFLYQQIFKHLLDIDKLRKEVK